MKLTALIHAAPQDSDGGPPSDKNSESEDPDQTFCKVQYVEDTVDETVTEIQGHIYARKNFQDQGYVDFYSKVYSSLRLLSLMLVGYPNAGKTCLVDSLLDRPFRETQCTNGIDLSTCTVTINHVETSGSNWNTPDQPIYERINNSLHTRLSDESQNSQNCRGMVESNRCCSNSIGSRQGPSLNGVMPSEMKIWDMSGEFGFYSTHQMFLSSASVFLLVMDITKNFDAELPLSCATRNQTGKIECPKTPREFLDYWLSTVGTFAGHSPTGADVLHHVVIVLTHTDLIDIEERDDVIDEYKKEVLNHVKRKYTCKYVHLEVFALSNKERDVDMLTSLRLIILELCQSKPTYGVQKPCTWLKLEADIQKFCSEVGKKYLPLETLLQYASRTFKMSFTELRSFLQFHHHYRNLIFTDNGPNSSIENPYMNVKISDPKMSNSLVVTDPQFLVDRFKEMITLWQFRQTGHLQLEIQREIDRDFERGLISIENLALIWNSMDKKDVENLTGIMVKLNQFIQCDSAVNIPKKYIVPALLPPSGTSELPLGPFEETDMLQPLVYLFHQSPNLEDIQSSGFLPVGLFFRLVANLKHQWRQLSMSFNEATFRAGQHSEILVNISTHFCVIVLKFFCIHDVLASDSMSPCVISQIRQRFEAGIHFVLKRTCPALHCSVCISPCRASFANFYLNPGCLERIGSLGNVENLKVAVCFDHSNHLSFQKFKCWFCEGAQQSTLYFGKENRKSLRDQQKLQQLAQKVSNVSKMKALGLALGLPNEKIEACNTNAPGDIELATSNMLFLWYNRELGGLEPGTSRDVQLTNALEKIGLANYSWN